MKPLVYIAAPYARPDPVENTHRVCKLATAIIEQGIVTPLVPHTSLLWHIIEPRPADFWYAYDLELLARCDALLRIRGESIGASAEVEFAGDNGIPWFDDLTALYDWTQTVFMAEVSS